VKQPLLLVCDHRGLGLGPRVSALAGESCRVETSAHLAGSLARLAGGGVELLVLAPLATGPGELTALELARRAQRKPSEGLGRSPANGAASFLPTLLVLDPLGAPPLWTESDPLARATCDWVAPGASDAELRHRLEQLLAQAVLAERIVSLQHSATHDDRTDLLRPNAFQEQLQGHFSAALRHRLDLTLLMLDLDRFGQVNKRFGHAVGDALIQQTGRVIARSLREEDLAGRYGGDEFSILLPYTRPADARIVVERLLEGMRGLSSVPEGQSEELRVSGSIGYETLSGGDLDSAEELARHAERAMRAAKRRGGDRAVYFRELDAGE
jgi:diguanylate cyclase (GGDEF)-like protein